MFSKLSGWTRALSTISAREACVHAAILAVVLWSLAVFLWAWPGPRDAFGTLKGADFVHFYTLGHLALVRDAATLYDAASQYALQTSLVPASAGDYFVPVYPPQTALVFAPLAALPYGWAVAAWIALTIVVYGTVVRSASFGARGVLADRRVVFLAAAAFPPFWNLVLHGQTTIVPLAAFALGDRWLLRHRRFLAGVVLGLIAIKPQLGLVMAVVFLVCGEWFVLLGAAVSVAVQGLASAWVFGSSVLTAYAQVARRLPELAPLLEPRPYQLHSIRAVTSLLPDPLGTIAWVALSAVVTWVAVRAWRSTAPVEVRFAIVVMASVLVSPHVTIYDATILALPILRLGVWMEAGAAPRLRPTYWPLVYWLFVGFLVPWAGLIRLQVSVVILSALFWYAATEVRSVAAPPTPHRRG